MIFRELSNAAFRFSLRRPGAEIMGGGGVQTPPPQQAVENPEAQQGAGYNDVILFGSANEFQIFTIIEGYFM